MEISYSSWPWHRSDATALAGYANMMMMMMMMMTEGFPWNDLRKIFRVCQRMANVPNVVEILPKISTA